MEGAHLITICAMAGMIICSHHWRGDLNGLMASNIGRRAIQRGAALITNPRKDAKSSRKRINAIKREKRPKNADKRALCATRPEVVDGYDPREIFFRVRWSTGSSLQQRAIYERQAHSVFSTGERQVHSVFPSGKFILCFTHHSSPGLAEGSATTSMGSELLQSGWGVGHLVLNTFWGADVVKMIEHSGIIDTLTRFRSRVGCAPNFRRSNRRPAGVHALPPACQVTG